MDFEHHRLARQRMVEVEQHAPAVRLVTHLQHGAGMDDLAPARALLDLAGVPYQTSVHVGRSAQTIARIARELHCDRIVMGQDGSDHGLARTLFGSVAAQVRQLLVGTGDCQVLGS